MAKPRIQSKDKWKSKVWYQILAPESFGEKELGETPASDPKKVVGRIVRLPASEITGNHRQGKMALFFKVNKVTGTTAKTEIAGFEMMKNYLHSIVRRRRDKVDVVQDLTSKDGVKLRVKSVLVTAGKCHNRQKKELAKMLEEAVKKEFESNEFETVLKQILEYAPQKAVKEAAKKLFPVSHVEIRKIELN